MHGSFVSMHLPQASCLSFLDPSGSVFLQGHVHNTFSHNSIQSGDDHMTRRNLLWISAGLFALTSTAHAQDFAVFDHDFGRERVSSSAALPRDAATTPGSKLRSRPRSKSSYREAIYLPLIREAELRYRPRHDCYRLWFGRNRASTQWPSVWLARRALPN